MPAVPKSIWPRPIPDWLLSSFACAVMACEVLFLGTGIDAFGAVARACLLGVIMCSVHRFGLREIYLLSVCTALTALIFATQHAPIQILKTCLSQGAFLMAFILLIGLLQQAAQTSDAVKKCGTFLTNQRPGRRYFALFTGAHFMALLFNLGVISLIAPLIKQGVRAVDDGLSEIRERRQISAMLQGFAWNIVWSPTAVAPIVLMTFLPEAKRMPWMAVGFAISVMMLFIGWSEDRKGGRKRVKHTQMSQPKPDLPVAGLLGFLSVCTALLALALLATWVTGQTIVFGLMVAAPLVVIAWLSVQSFGNIREAGARFFSIVKRYLPGAAPLAVTLACSGFIGRAAAALIPAQEWAAALGLGAMPGWVFLIALMLAVTTLSQFALSPIMMAVFFGSIMSELTDLPADVTWVALAISCGWALSMTISPFATTVLMTAQMTDRSGRQLTWQWNWRFTLLAIVALCCVFFVLNGGQ